MPPRALLRQQASPAQLLTLLEQLAGAPQAVTAMLRNPERLGELAPGLDPELLPRLAQDVAAARACDSICSPEADAARLAVGAPCQRKGPGAWRAGRWCASPCLPMTQ